MIRQPARDYARERARAHVCAVVIYIVIVVMVVVDASSVLGEGNINFAAKSNRLIEG